MTIGWEVYRSFLGVLDAGSLSGAARQLDITQPTVGRHIAALEANLNAPLFLRSQTGLRATELAVSLRTYAEAMASNAAALQRVAAGAGAGLSEGGATGATGVTGVVRVTASEIIGVEVLPAVVARLRERHPGLRVELMLSNATSNLLQREADIAVRMTQPRQQQLIARRVGKIELGLHATPAYLAAQGTPKSLAQLADHSLIGFDQATPFLRAASRSVPSWQRRHFALRSDSDLAQLALIRAGAGLGMCQVPIARRDGLTRVLPRQFKLDLETWIVMHEDLRSSAPCAAMFEALVAGLQAHGRAPSSNLPTG
jgi:DNA-binding transcriptional LysR family regulator